jgi:hypothetical protein
MERTASVVGDMTAMSEAQRLQRLAVFLPAAPTFHRVGEKRDRDQQRLHLQPRPSSSACLNCS